MSGEGWNQPTYEKPGWVVDNSPKIDMRSLDRPLDLRAGRGTPSKPVEVAPDALLSFAKSLQQELEDNFKPNAKLVRSRLMGGEKAAGPTFGVDPDHYWGKVVGNYHTDCGARAEILLQNFEAGLHALATIASRVADDYRAADADGGVDVSRVRGYFHGPDGDGDGSATQSSQPSGRGASRAI